MSEQGTRALAEREIVLTFAEWQRAKELADKRMKASNGHSYLTILKTRCQHCGRSPRDHRRCGQWFATFLSNLDSILLNLDRERAAYIAGGHDGSVWWEVRPEKDDWLPPNG